MSMTNFGIISVPVNYAAMERLDYNDDSGSSTLNLKIDFSTCKKLFDSGAIEKINKYLSIHIDLYEDEQITGIDKLNKFKFILKSIMNDNNIRTSNDKILSDTISKILKLTDCALKFNTGVFFYF